MITTYNAAQSWATVALIVGFGIAMLAVAVHILRNIGQ